MTDVIARADVPSWTDDQWRGKRHTPPPSFMAIFKRAQKEFSSYGVSQADHQAWARRRAAHIQSRLAEAGWVLVRDGQVVESNGTFEWRAPT